MKKRKYVLSRIDDWGVQAYVMLRSYRPHDDDCVEFFVSAKTMRRLKRVLGAPPYEQPLGHFGQRITRVYPRVGAQEYWVETY